jgi:hypothetical protein
MILEHYNKDELPIADDACAWRYMRFPKIWDMLNNNQLYFSRLDCFNDPMEGMPIEYSQAIYYANINRFEKGYIPEKIPTKEEVNNWQHGVFASCWYLTESEIGKLNKHEESLAMWQLYSDCYGFCIKIKFAELKKIIEKSLAVFDDIEVVKTYFGKVEYLSDMDNFFPQDKRKEGKYILRSSIKHISFNHENEVRFLLLAKNRNLNRKGVLISLAVKWIDVKDSIEIFAHPDMDDETFLIFKQKFNEIGFKLQSSRLLTVNVLKRYIK